MHKGLFFIVSSALITGIILVCQKAPNEKNLISASRKVTDGYMGELRMALSSAISHDGVAGAVDVCSELAPEVARKYSSAAGWQVKRVSLKVRNRNNAPDEFESQGLEILSERPPGDEEYYDWTNENGHKMFRYMRSIHTSEMCLNCHGDPSIFSPELKQILSAKYPGDNATGFRIGDFRGAFSVKIKWPEGKASVDSINMML